MILYKYLSDERIDVLEAKQIRFTQPIFLNDKYEALPVFHQVITNEGFESHIKKQLGTGEDINTISILREAAPFLNETQLTEIGNSPIFKKWILEIYPDLTDLVKLALTQKYSELMTEASQKFKESASSKFGILSLSEVYDSQTMWAHYANNNKGFIISFDSSHSFFNQKISKEDQIRFLRPVAYSKERPEWPTIDQNTNEKDFLLAIHKVFLTKHIDWEKEREWRMIMPLNKATTIFDNIYLFSFPADSIKEVILGADIEEKTKANIVKLVKADKEYSHIKMSQASINNSYSLELMPML